MLTKINGAIYNTREKQVNAFRDIVSSKGSLWGNPISEEGPIVKNNNISSEPYLKNDGGTGLILTGKYNSDHEKIAKKYSPHYASGIKINVGKKISDYGLGSTLFMSNGNRVINMSDNLDKDSFEFTLLHEIGHRVFNYDEKSSNNYAYRMMALYKDK